MGTIHEYLSCDEHLADGGCSASAWWDSAEGWTVICMNCLRKSIGTAWSVGPGVVRPGPS